MKPVLTLICALMATPVAADVNTVIESHILPGYAAFAQATETLAADAQVCGAEALRPAWNDAFDAWLGVSHLRFGPAEQDGRSVTIAFWPDPRGATPKALDTLFADQDPIINTPEGTTQISVAARGLFALEYLLYDPEFAEDTPYGCALIRALTTDLAAIARHIDDEWKGGYATTLRTAGRAGNTTFLSDREADQALFTALLTGLEFTADQRLGRPMGEFDRPRPARAEAWRSDRSQRNVVLSLRALSDLAHHLTGGAVNTDAALNHAIALASALNDPALAGVSDPSGRLKLEIVQQAVHAARDAAVAEIGPSLGVSAGFNSADGD
ncbi:imelysin family protein [Pseudotabrizicola sp. L79]|uniref:imelysin family protein n=1 Tax=Pseudotabrizicola sp. L79 TaxID=3118402 RepID=UPI002F94C4DB